MPSRPKSTLWAADPHTIAKVRILGSYLNAWFPIFGRSKPGQDLLYVDGFAGPSQYTNYDNGSPLVALRAAAAAIERVGVDWRAGDVHCGFMEERPDRLVHLERRIESLGALERVHSHTLGTTFVAGLKQLRQSLPRSFEGDAPLFVFIDPFGATGAPFSVVAEILESACSEVLVNLDADGIARIFRAARQPKRDELLDGAFGGGSWRDRLDTGADFPAQCRQVLALYVEKLRSLPRVSYVFPFEMRSHAGLNNYFLVFASQHPRGLVKMKEAMRSIDQTGDYSFCDAHVGQGRMFRFDVAADYAPAMYQRFVASSWKWTELERFALNETPFGNPKGMLRDLEAKGLISVVSSNPKRRKGTFKEDEIEVVEFRRAADGVAPSELQQAPTQMPLFS